MNRADVQEADISAFVDSEHLPRLDGKASPRRVGRRNWAQIFQTNKLDHLDFFFFGPSKAVNRGSTVVNRLRQLSSCFARPK